MSSDRKIKANRANARLSTGPKSPHGRARASKNALRHGLTIPVPLDRAWSDKVSDWAKKIAGPQASPERLEGACIIAEAQVDLCRIRSARHKILADALRDPCYESLQGQAKIAAVLQQEGKKLIAISRYERRVLSRRNHAIRTFDAMPGGRLI